MTAEAFNKILEVNPLIAELCNKLGLELDSEYYSSSEYKVVRAKELANKIVGNKLVSKEEAVEIMTISEGYTIDQGKAVVNFWLYHKIVKQAVAWFGTKKHVKTEIIFIGDVPF